MIGNPSSLQVDTTGRDIKTGTQELTPATPYRQPLASPLGDESVRGYATDERPKHSGAKQIIEVVNHLEYASIPCCMLGEAALIYYGAKRVMFDWIICVPDERLDQAIETFSKPTERYEAFRPSAVRDFTSLNHLYPRFKLVSFAVFFVLLPSQACHMPVQRSTIEYDRWIRIPYPKLPGYAQSLLDTWRLTDLEDLIDGMNLSIEWGEQHLNLEGRVDRDWACWRESKLMGRAVQPDEVPTWSELRRKVWHNAASIQAKKSRQGWKGRPDQETRFWKSGQQDPREQPKDYN